MFELQSVPGTLFRVRLFLAGMTGHHEHVLKSWLHISIGTKLEQLLASFVPVTGCH